ncbi:MAG: NAD/NADP octopine/nopaline dehydrogenase family protein [Rhodospirillales bacterium]|nr:NAD/NADP octopine/nopaline dehydrogenase family protein [Rhodospirillales bacterium]
MRAFILTVVICCFSVGGALAKSYAVTVKSLTGQTWNITGLKFDDTVCALKMKVQATTSVFVGRQRLVLAGKELSEGGTLGPVAEMTDAIHARRGGPPGPNSLDTRYVVEDVPFGLVPSVAIGRAAGVAMPLHEAGINLFSALYGRDFPAENDILPELGLERMNGEELHRLVGEGWKAE